MRPLLPLFVALLLLAGCGAAPMQTVETDRHTVQIQIEGRGLDRRTVLIEVRDRQGQPVSAESVVVAPVMRDMGMASPEVTAQPDGPGRYRAEGELFSMLGSWELDVRVRAGGAEETAVFVVDVQ